MSLPSVTYGTAEDDIRDWRDRDGLFDDNDNEDDNETPSGVAEMLGFDPDELDYSDESVEAQTNNILLKATEDLECVSCESGDCILHAGGPGSGWTTEEGHVSHKEVNHHVKMQMAAEANEAVLAKVLGGKSYADSEPIDVVIRNGGRAIGIEVKTLIYQTNDKITMNKGAIPRKLQWQAKTGAELYTVAIDNRNGKQDCYIRPGVGSWQLKYMTKVPGGFGGIKKHLGLTSQVETLPDKFPLTKAKFKVPSSHQWAKAPKHLRETQLLGEALLAGGPGSGRKCNHIDRMSTCTACKGRMHLSTCTSKRNKNKDCCPARHKMLHDQGHTKGLDDSSITMWPKGSKLTNKWGE